MYKDHNNILRLLTRSLIVLLTVVAFASCSNGSGKHSEIGKYVYLDCFNKIHIDRGCASKLLDDPKTEEERMANIQGVKFIDTCDLMKGEGTGIHYHEYEFCPKCVNDEAYQHLSSIMGKNENANYSTTMPGVKVYDSNNEDIKWLYGKLKAKGYNIGTEQEFTSSLGNEEDRQWYYEKAKGMGLNIGSMDDFDSLYAPEVEDALPYVRQRRMN